jgi:uncharacterized membrane protein HdeD (DUF308 family)
MSKSSLGVKLLGVFLILYGLIQILSLSFVYMNIVMGILALIAGILLLVGR